MINNFIIENKICCLESIPEAMNKIVIYCHGFGESKERITQHNEVLNKNNIGIISFDFPCHGNDLSDDDCFGLSNSILYLNKVIEYVRNNYNVPICLMGSSFGGYIILNRINNIDEKFDKVFLKFPAVNFFECTKRRLKIDFDYFENNNYYVFNNGRKMCKNSFVEFSNDDLMKSFNKHNNEIFIIHGDLDKTVLLEDVKFFCEKYDISLDIIIGAGHGMKDYLDVVNEKMIKVLKN